MVQTFAPVIEHRVAAEGIHVLALETAAIAKSSRAGQFLNLRLSEGGWGPLLRRPFSISRVVGDAVEIVFNVIGTGTRMLAAKGAGSTVDLLGPLGRPFGVSGPFETAILVGGGLGIAPLPFLTTALLGEGKRVMTFLGARTERQLYLDHIHDPHIATDDGTRGFHGTNVALLESYLASNNIPAPKLFACGPTPMMRAVAALAKKLDIPCEVSLEGEMACGVGICQGCPVERSNGEKKYALVCHDGPTFECREVNF